MPRVFRLQDRKANTREMEETMRILIADESTAGSKALRPLFKQAGAAARRAGASMKGAAAGQLVVSCAPRKRGRGPSDECACSGMDLGDQPEHSAAILDGLGIALLNRGCLDEGAALIELALKIRRKFFGNDHPETAKSLNSFARVQRERGEYDEAEAAAQDALRINRCVYGDDGLPVATSLLELGIVQLQRGLFGDAHAAATAGLQILAALKLTDSDPNTTRLMDVQARADAALDRLTDASDTYERILALDRKQLGTRRHPKYATHLANFGLVKERLGKRRQAARAYGNAITLYGQTLDRPCHPNLIDAHANLGSLLRQPPASDKELKQAGIHLKEALRLGSLVRGELHTLVGNDLANLGRWQYDTNQKSAAKKSFATALKIYERSTRRAGLPADHSYVAEALTWQGRLLVEEDTAAAAASAEPLLERAIAIWPAQRGGGTLGEGVAKAHLGRALFLQKKDPDRACALLCEGLRILSPHPQANPIVRRLKQWIRQQGCNCDGAPASAS